MPRRRPPPRRPAGGSDDLENIQAPVGNIHPDVSREGASRVNKVIVAQFIRICWILSVVGRWGMVAEDISFVYNKLLQPSKDLHNEMGSRLQSLRGKGTSPILPAWVEYIRDREPGDGENLGGIREAPGERGITRINVNGNPALVQRLMTTTGGWRAAREFEESLVAQLGEEEVEGMKDDIRHFAGIKEGIRLVRPGEKS